jgi:hypothetical protein
MSNQLLVLEYQINCQYNPSFRLVSILYPYSWILNFDKNEDISMLKSNLSSTNKFSEYIDEYSRIYSSAEQFITQQSNIFSMFLFSERSMVLEELMKDIECQIIHIKELDIPQNKEKIFRKIKIDDKKTILAVNDNDTKIEPIILLDIPSIHKLEEPIIFSRQRSDDKKLGKQLVAINLIFLYIYY